MPYDLGPRADAGIDSSCIELGFDATEFRTPTVKCRWSPPAAAVGSHLTSASVVMTPLVIDLDKDQKPEIVFSTFVGDLVAIRGDDCSQVWIQQADISAATQMAAADLDRDGFPELVAISKDQVKVFDHTGQLLAAGGAGQSPPSGSNCSGVSIADTDGDGSPEILVGGTLLKYIPGKSELQLLFSKAATAATWGNVSIFADIDGDGRPEILTGLEVYDGVTGGNETPTSLVSRGVGAYPAVADFNNDGFADIVVVESERGNQRLAVIDARNNRVLFGPFGVPGGGWGGTPTVGDYDGDGVPDIGLASAQYYYVYSLKCARTPKPAECTGTDPGVLWQRETHDFSSGGTGSSSFDFNGDGLEEVVYRDECWMRVFDGKTGATRFAQPITSGTCLEYPVIADVDNDGHADIVVPSDNLQGPGFCTGVVEGQTGQTWSGLTEGIFVLTDPLNRWMPSRPLWSSHGYHITEINDDLSVPTREAPNWSTWNSYRKNVQGMVRGSSVPQVDYTAVGAPELIEGDCTQGLSLTAKICNRGTATAPAGAAGTFYSSEPTSSSAARICSVTTAGPLPPGACESVKCRWDNAPVGAQTAWFRANDNGAGVHRSECKTSNDSAKIAVSACDGIN